jgi:hypothetical protein
MNETETTKRGTEMYALVNTMSSSQDVIGRVISSHYTFEAAMIADTKLQKQIKRNSPNSFLPVRIVETNRRKGAWVYPNDLA